MFKDKKNPRYRSHLIYSNMHITQWIGMRGAQKPFKRRSGRASQCLFPTAIPRGDIGPHVIRVM